MQPYIKNNLEKMQRRRSTIQSIKPRSIQFPEDEARGVYQNCETKKQFWKSQSQERKRPRNKAPLSILDNSIPFNETKTGALRVKDKESSLLWRRRFELPDDSARPPLCMKDDDGWSTTSSTDIESLSDFSEYDEEPQSDSNEPKPAYGNSSKDFQTRRASLNLYAGEGFEIAHEDIFRIYATPKYDPWDERIDRQGRAYSFHILGTSQHDFNARPHVLSPPIMHTLQSSLPFCKQGESFWLKYSMVRDGASMGTFLDTLHESPYTLMAIETVDGEVFGAFTTSTWNVQPSFFGGGESFVWRMKQSRVEASDSVSELARRETNLEIFPYSFENPFIQICQKGKVAIGGGIPCSPRRVSGDNSTSAVLEPKDFGGAIVFENDWMLEASSAPCVTFNSPSLSKLHRDGSRFELLNLEVWSFSPCTTLAEAQRMESHIRNLFKMTH